MQITREKACDGKRVYRTKTSALSAIAHTKRIGLRRNWEMNAYKCPFCGLWHVGHRERAVQELGRKEE